MNANLKGRGLRGKGSAEIHSSCWRCQGRWTRDAVWLRCVCVAPQGLKAFTVLLWPVYLLYAQPLSGKAVSATGCLWVTAWAGRREQLREHVHCGRAYSTDKSS